MKRIFALVVTMTIALPASAEPVVQANSPQSEEPAATQSARSIDSTPARISTNVTVAKQGTEAIGPKPEDPVSTDANNPSPSPEPSGAKIGKSRSNIQNN